MTDRAEKASSSGRIVGGGVRLGRVAGIDVIIHWSLIVIFWLIAANLGIGTLPAWHPAWGPALSWTIALLAAILFFASVLAHELSHALVARRFGVRVPRITLFLFGGIAQMEGEPRTPRAELFIAAIGPLTSIAIGVIATLIGGALAGPVPDEDGALTALAHAGPVATLLLWLGPINIVLGIFNLVPGFPLDGGRVLRAFLWWRLGDMKRATLWASRVGQGFAFLLMACGIAMALGVRVPFFGVGLLPGLWLLLIGWFLDKAARAGYEHVLVREALVDVPVASVMRPDVVVVPPDLPVDLLVSDHIMRSDQQAFPVVDAAGDLLGLVTLHDVRKVPVSAWPDVPVRSIMTPVDELTVVEPQAQVIDALQTLATRDVEQLPVVDHGRLSGLVRRRDIVKWLGLRGAFERA